MQTSTRQLLIVGVMYSFVVLLLALFFWANALTRSRSQDVQAVLSPGSENCLSVCQDFSLAAGARYECLNTDDSMPRPTWNPDGVATVGFDQQGAVTDCARILNGVSTCLCSKK